MRGIMQFGVLLLLLGLVAGEIQPLDKGVLAQIYQESTYGPIKIRSM